MRLGGSIMSHSSNNLGNEGHLLSPMEIFLPTSTSDPPPADDDPADTTASFFHHDEDPPRRQRIVDRKMLLRVSLGLGIIAFLGLWIIPQGATIMAPPARLSFVPTTTTESTTTTSTITIMQLADIHLGEAPNTFWGPEQDAKTWRALDSYIQHHLSSTTTTTSSSSLPGSIQLLVLSGDQITANDFTTRNATEYYLALGHRLAKYQIPFCFIFGNHDDKPNDHTQANYTNRQELMRVMQRHFRHWSLARPGPSHVTGVSNYWLNVYDNDDTNNMAARLLFLDTGGGQLAQQIDESHLSWMMESNQEHPNVPVVAFAHIPTNEFQYTSSDDNNNDNGNTEACVGENNEGGIAPLQDYDAGLVDTLARIMPTVAVLAVGHNHGNDYCCTYPSASLHLCFGRHSGYGGYGSWDRGARMYQLSMSVSDDNTDQEKSSFSWKSWVLMESGETQDHYGPFFVDWI